MGDRAKRRGTMHPAALKVWRHPLADLIVSPERAAWLQERYPPSDQGRPGILASTPQKKLRRAKDAPSQDGEEIPESGRQEQVEEIGLAA